MYSAVKSQVQTRAWPCPAWSETTMGTYFASILRCAPRSSKGFSRPWRQTFTPAREMSARSKSNATPERPAAARMRPQLGSAPAIAVFTSGEFAMVSAICFAARSLGAPRTSISITCRAPSPSSTICRASDRQTSSSAPQNFFQSSFSFVILRAPDAPLASSVTVSLVDVSPSTVMELNVRETTARNARDSSVGKIAASVARKPSMVAMLGWIIPAPLVQPRMRTCLPPKRHFAAAHLGRVSVVMIARVNSAKALAVRWRARTSRGIAFTIFCQRSGAPITPVEHTRICDGCRRPSSRASFSAVVAAAERPSEPVQQLALPELTITPRMRCADCRRCNCEAITGAAFTPLVVKTAAADAEVSLISIPKSSLDFFRPQCVAAKVILAGCRRWIGAWSWVCRSAGRGRGYGIGKDGQHDAFGNYRGDHRDEFAGTLLGATAAIAFDFFAERLARGCGETLAFEKSRRVRHGENARDAAAASFVQGGSDQAGAESLAAIFRVHRDGADFSEIGAIAFQRKAADDTLTVFLNDKVADIGANFCSGAGKQQALRGIVRHEQVNRSGVRNFRVSRSHGFSSSLARRVLKSCRAARTAPGAVPPRVARRARADSSVSAVAKLGPNAGENSLSRSSGISRMDIPSCSVARSTFPTISCASRKGTPKATK